MFHGFSLVFIIKCVGRRVDVVESGRTDDALQDRIDHELEVFDPICDGPVEYAEGMAFAKQIIQEDVETWYEQMKCDALDELIELAEEFDRTNSEVHGYMTIEDLRRLSERLRE